jgi:hypothetical protein
MLNSRPFGEVIHSIQQLGQEGNLACVLVQLNDTYFIDESPPRIPGMARVAAIVQTLRDEVLSSTGADNLLVLHSGDYLSPSSLNQKFHGQPMVDLLKLCGVRFATIGNHEFDFHKVDENIVWRRLADLHPCEHLLANLTPPPGRDIADVRFWPAGHPFIAITGLAGEQTIGKALKSGFSRKFDALELAVKDLMAKLDKHPEIRLFLVLSHMDRDEDKELEILLDKYWGHRGIAYILGGHDHDIDWTEFGPNVFLSKNLSNCKTMTVAVIRKDSLGSLYLKDLSLRLGLDIDQELALIDGRSRRSDREQAALIPAEVPIVLKQYIAAVRTSQPGNFTELPLSGDPPYTRQELMVFLLGFCRDRIGTIHHPDLHHAFERALSSYFATRGNDTFIEGIYTGEIVSDLVGIVIASASQDVGENLISLSPGLPVNELPTHVEATATVDFWKSQFAELAGPDREIANFMVDEMDATDDSLRSRSTDFGNFIADAVKSASGAEVALLNSGAFRIDSRVSGRINLHMLHDTFVFDNVGSIFACQPKI